MGHRKWIWMANASQYFLTGLGWVAAMSWLPHLDTVAAMNREVGFSIPIFEELPMSSDADTLRVPGLL